MKKVYIFVPRYLHTGGRPMRMPSGRMGAQCAHAAAKMAVKYPKIGDITTLIMEVKNSRELYDTATYLFDSRIPFRWQLDNLPNRTNFIAQALITEPLSLEKAAKLRHYKLWKD